jgi:hypothetical protein
MKNAKLTMGDLGISTRPISFAPQVKLDKEALLKKFRKKLEAKGYSPAQALSASSKVRGEANSLAVEVNARQGNDDPVRMGQIHMMALRIKIRNHLKQAPSVKIEEAQRISKTAPMSVSVAEAGKAYDTRSVRQRALTRNAPAKERIYKTAFSRKDYGVFKENILNEAKRASYMAQFNGTMGWRKPKWLKKAQSKAKKVVRRVSAPVRRVTRRISAPIKRVTRRIAAPIKRVTRRIAAPIRRVSTFISKPVKKAVKYTAKSFVRAAKIVKKDPIGALAKITVAAPFTVIASIAPKHTKIGKLARKAEKGAVKVVKKVADLIGKALKLVKKLVMKALEPIIRLFKKALDGVKKTIVNKVAARFGGKGVSGFGSMPEKDQKKILALTGNFMAKKAGEAIGMQTTIMGTASAAAVPTATATVTTAAAAAGPAAPAVATAAAPAAATSAAGAATPVATASTYSYATKLAKEGVSAVSADFAKYKASEINNPVVKAVVNAGIDGKIPTNPAAVKQMAAELPAKAQAKFVNAVTNAPEKAKQEIIKRAIVPQEFKKAVNFIPKEARALAEGKPAIPQLAIANAMQKAYSMNPKLKTPSPQQAKAQAALGVAAQDEMTIELVKEGKLTMTEGIAASSKIGKENAIKQLPPEVRAQAVKEIKKEMTPVEKARIDEKVSADKTKSNTALLTAAAVAAKVLLF